jgi:uncharacterized membrane protein
MSKIIDERPQYQSNLLFVDLLGRNFSRLLLLFLWLSVFYMYKHLPDIIPTHFNVSGEVDDYGNKYTLFLIPLLGTVLFVVMSILVRYPEKFNYPVKITPTNAQRQYVLATRLIRWLNVTIMIVFNGLLWLIYYSAIKSEAVQAMFIAVLLILLTFVPLVIYFIASYRQKN